MTSDFPVEDIVADMRAGRMVIWLDEEDRGKRRRPGARR
jgi:3,4-dihydroxy-2-butanone 4-phosphate synthase